jgi:hypothetical protein
VLAASQLTFRTLLVALDPHDADAPAQATSFSASALISQ